MSPLSNTRITVVVWGIVFCHDMIVRMVQEGKQPEAMKKALRDQHGIHVWVSPLSSTRIDMEARGLASCVRSSVHYYNTEGEVDSLVTAARTL